MNNFLSTMLHIPDVVRDKVRAQRSVKCSGYVESPVTSQIEKLEILSWSEVD
jgi:hypothetical protein